MLNGNFLECRSLPAINETFPLQFNRPISLLSPLDLSLRASNAIPITPPSTPSPPRKRRRLMSDENFLWRPHVMETAAATATATVTAGLATAKQIAASFTTTTTATTTSYTSSYFDNLTYTNDEVVDGKNKDNYLLAVNNLEDIPQSHKASTVAAIQGQQQQLNADLATIYVDDDDDNDDDDDETILLTEDEAETLVSSHDYKPDGEDDDEDNMNEYEGENVEKKHQVPRSDSKEAIENKEKHPTDDMEEDEYVDVLSNDDDEAESLSATALLRLQTQAEAEKALENSGKVLTRTKLIYEDAELHQKAVDGLSKLFDREFCQKTNEDSTLKTYTDLTTLTRVCSQSATVMATAMHEHENESQPSVLPSPTPAPTRNIANHPKTYKTGERKRMKLRKHLSNLDEDTISPVSGTIIRKLRDDEELVVRKGDIDPAFNVVEITEEAKAILASIDNKIGDYLCQLCRTLYDDAFQLAQHRCPRIVHIEYKCLDCEKVFNCPANLASHRRWHKPKSELLANGQKKSRPNIDAMPTNSTTSSNTKLAPSDGNTDNTDGIYHCAQCGKTFRRHAYLKKHQASHRMLDNLHSLDIFKSCNSMANIRNMSTYSPYHQVVKQATTSSTSHQPNTAATLKSAAQIHAPHYQTVPTQLASASHHHHANKLYPPRFGTFPFAPHFDQRRLYNLEDLYLSQQLERTSAFQCVQATHFRNMTATNNGAITAGSTLLGRPPVPTLSLLSVK